MLGILVIPLLVLALGWASLALWFDGPSSRSLAGLLAGSFLSTAAGILALVRPLRRGTTATGKPTWRAFRA